MLAAAALTWLLAFEARSPCADSLAAAGAEGADFWLEESWEPASPEPCDLDASLLFALEPVRAGPRDSERAALSLTRVPGRGLESATRHQARRGAWSHRLEVRGRGGDARLA